MAKKIIDNINGPSSSGLKLKKYLEANMIYYSTLLISGGVEEQLKAKEVYKVLNDINTICARRGRY